MSRSTPKNLGKEKRQARFHEAILLPSPRRFKWQFQLPPEFVNLLQCPWKGGIHGVDDWLEFIVQGKAFDTMVLLVTGAMGHVGYEVAKQAAAAGELVVAQYRNRFRAGDAEAVGGNATWAHCELSDPDAVAELTADRGIDECIHLAAVSNEAFARPDPLAAFQSNLGALANLLDLARRRQWRRFVFVSTGSVFQGMSDVTSPILEDAPTSVANIYGTTKLCGELLTRMYRSQFGVSAATVRISWVYGPPVVSADPTRGPIPGFLRKALRGAPVRDPGGADFAASFTYVGDVAAGLLATCKAPELNFDLYHLGSGINFTTGQVADAIRTQVPGAVIELGPGTEPWTTHTAQRGPLAGDRLRRDTGFTVAPSLDAGIAAYAAWMRAQP
jgi:nucleoside-diphosphate-sugar epimerase